MNSAGHFDKLSAQPSLHRLIILFLFRRGFIFYLVWAMGLGLAFLKRKAGGLKYKIQCLGQVIYYYFGGH